MAAKASEYPGQVRGQIELFREMALGNFRDLLLAVTGFTIEFQGVVPTKITLSKYTLPGVVTGEARFTNDAPLKGIEYRIKLFTQDPAQITFPDKIEPGKPPSAQPVPMSDNRTTIIVLVCLAGLAAGALVYFAMLRIGSRTRP